MRSFILTEPVPYREGLAVMEHLVDLRAQGVIPDVLLVLEHAPVITIGRARGASANVLRADRWDVVEVSRGGDVTVHLPGQLVAYPILALPPEKRDLIQHMRNLEQAIIALLADLGIEAGRDPRNTGVWIPHVGSEPRKVAAVGIACRRWVTWHGLSLNIDIDLERVNDVRPCGFAADSVTHLRHHMHSPPTLSDISEVLPQYIAHECGVPLEGPAMHCTTVHDVVAELTNQR